MFYRGEPREQEAARLEGEIAAVCGLLNATTARLVALIADVLATGSWTGHGIRSAEHWVAWQCGVSAARAHKLVVMARRLTELPAADAAFAAGELSEDQVAVVARHAPVHNDAEVTEFARHATVSQLSRTLRTYPFVHPEETEPELVEERRDVSFGYADNGRWRLFADLPGDEGALIERTLVTQRDALFHDADMVEQVTWADALLALADSAATACASRAHPDRSTILVHLATSAENKPAAHLHGGPALPDALRRLLTCDARIRPLWEIDGVPISLGRARRTVPDRTRIIVEERDRGCSTPGCPHTRWLHIHHIVHWEDGGPTNTANLVCLCPFHHRAHHRGQLGIAGNADETDGVRFTDRHGRSLAPNAVPTAPGDAADETAPRLGIRHDGYRHPTGEHLDRWSIAFDDPPEPPEPPSGTG